MLIFLLDRYKYVLSEDVVFFQLSWLLVKQEIYVGKFKKVIYKDKVISESIDYDYEKIIFRCFINFIFIFFYVILGREKILFKG